MSRGIIVNSQTREVQCSSYVCGVAKNFQVMHNKIEVLVHTKNK